MGRFKIYDPKELVTVLIDTNYAKCRMCEKKLKNVMGNIKRHYEQMHSILPKANGKKKRKRKSRKFVDKSIEYTPPKKSRDISNNSQPAPTQVIGTITHRANKKLSNSITKVDETDGQKNWSPVDVDTAVNAVTQNGKKLPSQEGNLNESHNKKQKLNNEKDEFQTACNSYINKIQISSLESCHLYELLTCLVETKTEHHISLREIPKDLNLPESNSKDAQQNFPLSPQIICENIRKTVHKLREDITKIVSNRLVHLKLDIASTRETNIMLINIQFITDFEIKVITLSALELLNDHMVTYLKDKVLKILENYKIEMSRVFSITKDYVNIVEEEEESKATTTQLGSDEYCQHLIEQYPGHAIHFVACDIIKQLNENISQSRDSARKLRLKMSKLNTSPMPEIDNSLNWISIYDMMKSLLDLRKQLENNKSLLVEVDWIFVTKFEASFRPVVECALMLKSNNHFIIGDLYRELLLCEMKLNELGVSNELALYLLKALKKRKSNLFENTTFLAALYLDPRYCYMGSMHLQDKQKEMAIAQLLRIFNKLKALPEAEITHTKSCDGRYAKLDKMFCQTMCNNHKIKNHTMANHFSLYNVDSQCVQEALEQLQFEQRLPFGSNILDHWEMSKHKNSIVAKIAEIALAAPATQASINRAINAWPMSLMKRKFNIQADNIENILLLKLNQDLVDNIKLA